VKGLPAVSGRESDLLLLRLDLMERDTQRMKDETDALVGPDMRRELEKVADAMLFGSGSKKMKRGKKKGKGKR